MTRPAPINPYQSPRIEGSQPSLYAAIARFFGLRPTGRCSYCGEKKRPLVEGLEGVLICRECAEGAIRLIDEENERIHSATKK
jgi:hypothetical protein